MANLVAFPLQSLSAGTQDTKESTRTAIQHGTMNAVFQMSDVCRVTAAKLYAAFKHLDNINIVALISSFHFPPHFPFTPSPRGSIRRKRTKKEHQELSCV